MCNLNHIIKALLTVVILFAAGTLHAQDTQTLKGRIVDSEGNPVVGAIVNVAEENRIVLSDENGNFSLTGVAALDEICVSAVGYVNAQVPVDFGAGFQITMASDLDEYLHTTPVAFGRKPKKLVTESTSVVTGEELQKHPVTVLQNAFTSTVTGMQTYEWSSEPGWTETAMYIRGIRTMNVNARAPLVIVDNMERDLSFLDAFPIENITVLKDAAATAIYGMRGANGAILVTTKRGAAGKTMIDITQEVGFNMLSDKMENQNSYNMALTRNRVSYLSGGAPIYSDQQVEMYRRLVVDGEQFEGIDKYRYFNTNWFDVLYRELAPTNKTNMQISGGNDIARYYVSFSYLRQEGMWNDEWTNYNEGFKTGHTLNRYNLRSNLDINVTKYLNVSLDLGGRIDDISQPNTGVFNLTTFGAVEANPMEPVFTPDGRIYGSATAQNAGRHLAASGIGRNRRRNLYSTVNVTGDLGSLTPGLKANATISFDSYETFQSNQTNSVNAYSYDYNNMALTDVSQFTYRRYTTYQALGNPSANQRDFTYNLNMLGGLSYNRTFGLHSVEGRVFARSYRQQPRISGNDNAFSSSRYLSYNAQVNYNYANRYLLAGNFSRMGSDNFREDVRWGNFYGGSVGWVASEEAWLKNDNLDLLKLRVSYGTAGQANTNGGRYAYQNTYGVVTGGATSNEQRNRSYWYGWGPSHVIGYRETQAGNANNIWELSTMANVGIDFDLWNKKLYGSVDAFKEWRSQILVDRTSVPQMLGVAVARDSYGKAETKGFEVTLGHRGQVGKRFKYHVEAMLTYNTNKITEMDETEPNVEWQRKTGKRIIDNTEVAALYENAFNNTLGGWSRYKFVEWATDASLIATSQDDAIAHPEKYPYHTASAGNQLLGTAVFRDLNGDRQIDINDMIPDTYTILPELIPAINIGFEYAGFDARAVFNAYLNRDVFISPAMAWSGWGNQGTHEVVKTWGYYTDDPWDPRNVNATYPRPVYGGYSPIDSERSTGTYKNDIFIVNGNYLSLRNIEIGYSLPKRLIAKINMTKLRVYFSGYNLQTWSNLPKGLDPEKPMSYVWWYPKTRTFSFGVNIGF
jgi:TonB-linked SusC/RagA family outer membrane protein